MLKLLHDQLQCFASSQLRRLLLDEQPSCFLWALASYFYLLVLSKLVHSQSSALLV